MTKSRAPWTVEEVQALNDWQHCGWVHPFTCARSHVEGRNLVATLNGWLCLICGYRQDWCHDFMLAGPPSDPIEGLKTHLKIELDRGDDPA